MRLGVLFSGGKDSCYAMYRAMQTDEIVCLISVIPDNKESYMFHTPNIELVDIQSEALEIPIVKVKTKGEKEKELKELKEAIEIAKKKYKIEGVVTGAIASTYQASRIQKICNELKIECFNPVWQSDQIELLKEMIKKKFKILIVGVAGYPLDDKWLGTTISEESLNKMMELKKKYKINPAGEGGEIETFVIDSPIHKKKMIIEEGKKKYSNHYGILNIKTGLK